MDIQLFLLRLTLGPNGGGSKNMRSSLGKKETNLHCKQVFVFIASCYQVQMNLIPYEALARIKIFHESNFEWIQFSHHYNFFFTMTFY